MILKVFLTSSSFKKKKKDEELMRRARTEGKRKENFLSIL